MPVSARPHPDPAPLPGPSRLIDNLTAGVAEEDPLLQFQPQGPDLLDLPIVIEGVLSEEGPQESRPTGADLGMSPPALEGGHTGSHGVSFRQGVIGWTRPARNRVWVLSFVGGCAAGAMAMWLFRAPLTSETVVFVNRPVTADVETARLPTAPVSDETGVREAPASIAATGPSRTSGSPEPAAPTAGAEYFAASSGPATPLAATGGTEIPGSAATAPTAALERTGPSATSAPAAASAAKPATPSAATGRTPTSSTRKPAIPSTATERTAPARPPAVADMGGFLGSVAVQSNPPGAAVFVNGQRSGSTPVVLKNLRIGSRVIRIEADGYRRWSSAVRVVANQQQRITATLEPAP